MTTLYGKQALSVLTSNAYGFEEIDEGEQRKYNHADCHMGVDTRERLYVKNVDGAYMWHCHNCGDSGFFRPKETVARMKASSAVLKSERPLEMYPMELAKAQYSDFPIEAQMWLEQYEFDEEMCLKYGIKANSDGVFLPTKYRVLLTGYQQRRYNKKPKYITNTRYTHSYIDGDMNKPLVIVEDLLSSYKLNYVGYPTLCLLGTKLDPTGLIIVSGHKRVVVWLDDDEAGHKASMQIFKEIGPVCPRGSAMFMEQPKEIPLKDLIHTEL